MVISSDVETPTKTMSKLVLYLAVKGDQRSMLDQNTMDVICELTTDEYLDILLPEYEKPLPDLPKKLVRYEKTIETKDAALNQIVVVSGENITLSNKTVNANTHALIAENMFMEVRRLLRGFEYLRAPIPAGESIRQLTKLINPEWLQDLIADRFMSVWTIAECQSMRDYMTPFIWGLEEYVNAVAEHFDDPECPDYYHQSRFAISNGGVYYLGYRIS